MSKSLVHFYIVRILCKLEKTSWTFSIVLISAHVQSPFFILIQIRVRSQPVFGMESDPDGILSWIWMLSCRENIFCNNHATSESISLSTAQARQTKYDFVGVGTEFFAFFIYMFFSIQINN